MLHCFKKKTQKTSQKDKNLSTQRYKDMMLTRSKKIITHRTPADGNIFADLGFAPDEAQRLQAEADMAIDAKRALKQTLMTEIVDWIDAHNLKQAQAAEILGITRPRVSDVVNQKTPKFTVDSLVDMVLRTGKHVQLSVQS